MRLATVVVCAFALGSCLPKDTRPPPGELRVVASADDAIQSGVLSADGWQIQFDSFFVSLGHVSVEGDECIGYSDPEYNRVLEMTQQGGPQTVNLVYALGACELDFELSSPSDDSVLGQGVSATDRELMRTPVSDPYVTEAGISFRGSGRATRGGVSKTFNIAYRRRIDYATCVANVAGKTESVVRIGEDAKVSVDLTVSGATLFADHLDPAQAQLRFDPFAAADDVYGDADGAISLGELAALPLTEIADDNRYADSQEAWTSLGDYIYHGLFTKLVRYRGNGTCEQEVFPNDRTPR